MARVNVTVTTADNKTMKKGVLTETKNYWLILGEGDQIVTINVGEATYRGVVSLIETAYKTSDQIKEQLKDKVK